MDGCGAGITDDLVIKLGRPCPRCGAPTAVPVHPPWCLRDETIHPHRHERLLTDDPKYGVTLLRHTGLKPKYDHDIVTVEVDALELQHPAEVRSIGEAIIRAADEVAELMARPREN
ncbi:UNVERIFIED_CONTAM: hypothetical protein LK11_06935 [Mumia flava]